MVFSLRRKAKARSLEAAERHELIETLNLTFDNIATQAKQIPSVENMEKLAQSLEAKEWLKERMEIQILVSDGEDPVVTCAELIRLNTELVQGTVLDPAHKERTVKARTALESFRTTPRKTLIFNPLENSYPIFIQELRDHLCDNYKFGTVQSEEGLLEQIFRCYLLEFQRTSQSQPPRWMILELRNEPSVAKVFMRSDNLYVCGFENQVKQIYELGNAFKMPLIEGSIPFGCDSDYPDLVNFEKVPILDGNIVIARITQIVFNLIAVAEDIKVLSDYDHTKVLASVESEKEAKKRVQIALARIAIGFAEVSRLMAIFALVVGGWDTIEGSYLTDLLFKCIRRWKDMSDAVRNHHKGKIYDDHDNKMRFICEAFRALYLVLNTKGTGMPSKPPKQPKKQRKPKPPESDAGNDNTGNYPGGGKGSADVNDDQDGGSKHDTGKHNLPFGVTLSQEQSSGLFELRSGGQIVTTREHGMPSGASVSQEQSSGGTYDGGNKADTNKHNVPSQVTLNQGKFVLNEVNCHLPSSGLLDLLNPGGKKIALTKSLSSSSNTLFPQLTLHRIGDEPRGEPLVEVFKIHTNCSSIKSVGVYDDRGGNYFYQAKIDDIDKFLLDQRIWLSSTHLGRKPSDFMHELLISGPGRAMSACPSCMIEVDSGDQSGVFQLPLDCNDLSLIDKPRTFTIVTNRGNVYVTACVLSNAVKAFIDVRLRFDLFRGYWIRKFGNNMLKLEKDMEVVGDLQIRIDNVPIGYTIFSTHTKMPYVPTTEGKSEMTQFEAPLPLTRSIFALPVGCTVHITGGLVVGGGVAVSVDQCMTLDGHCDSSEWALNSHCSAVVHIQTS